MVLTDMQLYVQHRHTLLQTTMHMHLTCLSTHALAYVDSVMHVPVLLHPRGSGLCLAVLFPRKLAVFTLQAVGSSYLQLDKLYEHYLDHTAANMAIGGFGGISGGWTWVAARQCRVHDDTGPTQPPAHVSTGLL